MVWLNHHRIFQQVFQVDGPLLVLNLNVLLRTALVPFPTAVVAEYLDQGGEPAQTAVVVYGAVFLLLGLSFGAMFAWVTRDDRLLGRLPPPEVVRAAPLRFMVGSVAYSLAIALAFVSPLLALALHGATALYYTFDQASVPTERAPADRRPPGRQSSAPRSGRSDRRGQDVDPRRRRAG